jgi:hypothetical protein
VPHSEYFAKHWIIRRSTIDLPSLLPFVAPRRSRVVPQETPEELDADMPARRLESDEVPAAAAAGEAKGRGGKKGIKRKTKAEEEVSQVEAEPDVDMTVEERKQEPAPSPPKRVLKKAKPAAKAAAAPTAAPAKAPVRLLTAEQRAAVDSILAESSLKALRTIALSLGLLHAESVDERDFQALVNYD